MTIAPLPLHPKTPPRRPAPARRETVSAAEIARRRRSIAWAKRLLPAAALTLLATIALWPEIARQTDRAERALRGSLRGAVGSGRMVSPRYQSVDEKGRPYTITAASAVQAGEERIDLTAPIGDILLQSGTWLRVQSKTGVYLQHQGKLDLAGDVWLYRDDGTTMRTQSAALDLNSGAGAGAQPVSAEGPFGTLDAMGFAAVSGGAELQFAGPARLVLDERK